VAHFWAKLTSSKSEGSLHSQMHMKIIFYCLKEKFFWSPTIEFYYYRYALAWLHLHISNCDLNGILFPCSNNVILVSATYTDPKEVQSSQGSVHSALGGSMGRTSNNGAYKGKEGSSWFVAFKPDLVLENETKRQQGTFSCYQVHPCFRASHQGLCVNSASFGCLWT
jgi:hypothetical protein